MRRLDNNDDLIDFPCSDDWLDYYHERGLTPRRSNRPSREAELLEAIKRQNEKILELLTILANNMANSWGDNNGNYTQRVSRWF